MGNATKFDRGLFVLVSPAKTLSHTSRARIIYVRQMQYKECAGCTDREAIGVSD